MRKLFALSHVTVLLTLVFLIGCQPQSPVRVLVFSKTAGYRHSSIEPGVEVLRKLGQVNGFEVVATEDAAYFTEDSLRDFSAVVFFNTTMDVLDYPQQADFERYIQAGGGFMGIHAATDTEYDWPWYGKLVGGYFASHPKVQEATLRVTDRTHGATKHLPETWVHTDEWYNFKQLNPDVHVLIEIDESTYEGGKNGANHPIAWYHEFDGGRAFYTELGHTEAAYEEPAFLDHLLGGIQYAVGDNQRNYRLAKSDRMPLENRFVRTVLAQNLEEPMEVDVLDEDHLIFIQRHGAVFTYNLKESRLDSITSLPLFSKLEEGLIGMAVDPNYTENNWLYFFYSDPGEEPVQHVSRFVFKDNQLDYSSEKILLDVKTQRDQCCHSGGSMEFGPDGLLYISTGDNTNPFASDGFAPADEQPGRSPWDAQKSAANTNDLRGKILRIKPEPDGTYSIPEGNLFPPGTPQTRPEIFVMGCRNPFRISVDQKNGFLYWGDVGPDAGKDIANRGPKGHDEFNQAQKAGFWGWPYSRGNNKPYYDYDFATKTSGELRNVEKPINDSPNNTGLKELPPIQPSLIWYSYDRSDEFPWMGTGGKNPMAGPVFYESVHGGGSEKGFPDYFEGKAFFYEWMRDWIFIITLDENHNYVKADPFMEHTDFANPVDMVFGKDGNLYLLEYGEKWNSRNLDARLSKIEYVSGNRNPVARIEVDKTVGAAPLTVSFSGKGSEDFDRDPLSYAWALEGDATTAQTEATEFTFDQAGTYRVQLTVKDPKGNSATATQEILVGNDAPAIQITADPVNDFFWDNKMLDYTILVTDKEDGSTQDGSIDAAKVKTVLSYIPEGLDLAGPAMGHQQEPKGKVLIAGSDCKTCHAANEKINGPSYEEIANRYGKADIDKLANKIIRGGSGVWGETAMPAHPQHTIEDVREMVRFILSQRKTTETAQNIPLSGSIRLSEHIDKNAGGRYVILATYADAGGGPITSLSAQEQLSLRAPRLEAEDADESSDEIEARSIPDGQGIGKMGNNHFIAYKDLGLEGLSQVDLDIYFNGRADFQGKIEVRLDSRNGKLIGSKTWQYTTRKATDKTFPVPVEVVSGRHDLYFIFKDEGSPDFNPGNLDGINLRFEQR